MAAVYRNRIPNSCLVYTPSELADGMVKALKIKSSDKVLEPCVGEGALLRALSVAGVGRKQIFGLDLQKTRGQYDSKARVIRGTDYMSWSRVTNQRFDKIIANPPYIAIERLQKEMRSAACNVAPFDGLHVKAASNTWYAFLIASLGLLKPSGSLCFVLPAAWDFVNYADHLRSTIGNWFERVEIHRSQSPLFQTAGIQDGSVVIVAHRLRKRKSSGNSSRSRLPQRFEYQTPAELIKGLETTRKGNFPNWANDNSNCPIWLPSIRKANDFGKLGDAVSIGIGGVTGDASFFLLNEGQRIEHSLPVACMRPVVSRARHLISPSIGRNVWERLKTKGERVWLFDPPPSAIRHHAVKSYIRWGVRSGCNLESQKIAERAPWFRARLPSLPDGYLSGMSSSGPMICFREMDRLTATNTLYVVYFNRDLSTSDRAAVSLALLTSRVADRLSRIGRSYADGLIKFEPVDLRLLEIPRVART